MKETCPNCGAAITEEKCPYCGSMFFDFACIDMDKPCYIKIKQGNLIHRVRCMFNNMKVETAMNDSFAYADNSPYFVARTGDHLITMEFRMIPDDNNILRMIVNTEEVPKDARPW